MKKTLISLLNIVLKQAKFNDKIYEEIKEKFGLLQEVQIHNEMVKMILTDNDSTDKEIDSENKEDELEIPECLSVKIPINISEI